MRRAAIAFLRLYQLVVRPLLAPACRFEPSCSAYAIEAVRLHGVVLGGRLAAWRLARCHPWCDGGWDPVPEGAPVRHAASCCRSPGAHHAPDARAGQGAEVLAGLGTFHG